MFQAIVDWYKLYTPGQFMLHKTFHVVVGFVASGVIAMLTQHVTAGIATAFVLGVLKEVYDHSQLVKDPTNPADKVIYHALDVIVTTLGGCAVLFISRMW